MDIVRRYVSIYGHDMQRDFDKLNPLDSLLQDKAVIMMDRKGE